MSRFFLRRLIIALAATVPLLAILAWTLSRGVDDTRDTAYRKILAKSRSAARSVDDALDLVSNAIKYNRRGGTVTIGVEALDGIGRITIADTGRGMSQAQLAGLFKPFNLLGRERRKRRHDGPGRPRDADPARRRALARRAAAKAVGAVDDWTKPIVVETFCRKMSELLEASPVQRRVP